MNDHHSPSEPATVAATESTQPTESIEAGAAAGLPASGAEALRDGSAHTGSAPTDGPASQAHLKVKARYLVFSLAVLVLDQLSKWLIELKLPEYETYTLIPGLLNFVHVRNTGVAFGLFPAHGDVRGTLVLAGLGLFALSFVLYYFWHTPPEDRLLLISLSAIIGGAIGNLIDRVASGGVTDFVDFHFQGYHWHTFNVADSAITIGIGLMLLSSLRPVRGEEGAPSASPAG